MRQNFIKVYDGTGCTSCCTHHTCLPNSYHTAGTVRCPFLYFLTHFHSMEGGHLRGRPKIRSGYFFASAHSVYKWWTDVGGTPMGAITVPALSNPPIFCERFLKISLYLKNVFYMTQTHYHLILSKKFSI